MPNLRWRKVNISMHILSQDRAGSVGDISGSFCLDIWNVWQTAQPPTTFFYIRNETRMAVTFLSAMRECTSVCDKVICWKISALTSIGSTTRSPLNTSPSHSANSSANVINSFSCGGKSAAFVGHPMAICQRTGIVHRSQQLL
jgi:hypothetical protein